MATIERLRDRFDEDEVDEIEDRVEQLARGEVEPMMEGLSEEWEEKDTILDWINSIPVWNPQRLLAYANSGLTIFVAGHKGSGKSRTTTLLCEQFAKFIDRVQCVSGTDCITHQYTGDANIVHPVYVEREAEIDFIENLYEERESEMLQAGADKSYDMRTKLVIFDDAAQSRQVLDKKTKHMIHLTSNTRHMKLFLLIVIQSMGYVAKYIREQADMVFICRETLPSTLEMTYLVYFKGIFTAWQFREMVDTVCIEGKRCLMIDYRNGGLLYQVEMNFDKIRLPKPIGNKAWNEWADQYQIEERASKLEGIAKRRKAALMRFQEDTGKKKGRGKK